MKILAAITKPEAICKILEHLGIPSEAPRRTSARPPPQAELSGAADRDEVDYTDPPSPEWWPISAPNSGAGLAHANHGFPRINGLVFPRYRGCLRVGDVRFCYRRFCSAKGKWRLKRLCSDHPLQRLVRRPSLRSTKPSTISSANLRNVANFGPADEETAPVLASTSMTVSECRPVTPMRRSDLHFPSINFGISGPPHPLMYSFM
jgi:hypothetical protein